MLRRFGVLLMALCIVQCLAGNATAQDLIGQPIVEVVFEEEGQRVVDPTIADLVQTRAGRPLSMSDVRATVDHLLNLRRYDDIQPIAEATAGGVRLRYVLVPSHRIDTVRFTGKVALSETDLRRLVTDRFGRSANPNRVPEVVTALQAEYRRRGYPAARINQQIATTHDPHRSILTFAIEAGPRARIAEVTYRQIDAAEANVRFPLPQFRMGEVYDELRVDDVCMQWEERMRAQGFYEASASCRATQADDAYLFVNVRRGPLVAVEFSGDPLTKKERDQLVPIRSEASTDEDLLEDAKLAIERHFHAGGYRDAQANYTRDESTPGQLTIRFQVMRGARYTVDSVRIMGNRALSTAELEEILMIVRGDVFIAATLDQRRSAIQTAYIERGFRRAVVKTDAPSLPNASPDSSERRVEVIVAIEEGPRTTVRSVNFKGNAVFTASQLRGSVPVGIGGRYLASEVAEGRDAIAIRYQNQGYLDVAVREETTFADADTQADVTYAIVEGPQAIVEHIIIVGNDKTKTETIVEELEFQEGGPLGRAAQDNSRTRLARLGLFRQVTFTVLNHATDARRDVLIEIQEADRTTFGYSFGVEGALRARPTGPGGSAEDHLELAPRGAFEIGRRNLFGTNRSVNLFARVSLRSTDVRTADTTTGDDQTESNLGFNEYRVVGSFREPRFLSGRSELLITGIVEQAIRTTFNFSRRIARAEVATSLTPAVSLTGRYTFERTKLFDEIFAPDEKPLLIDKLFPEVRLSKFAGSLIYDTRDDLLDPNTGTSFLVDTDVAMRAVGSEVGFLRTFAQAYYYRQLPVRRRTIVALGARLGAARGFERVKEDQLVSDLPASERFFAGGDSTVRGFSLDRLVGEDTVSPTGFPLGGNGVMVLNGELRVHLGKALHGVGFVDAGTVSKFAGDLSLTNLRPAAGAGLRIESPFGPIRLDLGVNLDPRDFTGVSRERRWVFHISIGQAF